MIKSKLLACAALALGGTSCLGPNHAIDTLSNWNATATDQDWLNEVIFLGLNVIPVYGVAWLADVVVLNTIDYWSGENPMDDPGPFPDEAFTAK